MFYYGHQSKAGFGDGGRGRGSNVSLTPPALLGE